MTRPICTVEGCDRPHEARGWCAMHYRRAARAGLFPSSEREAKVCEGCGRSYTTSRTNGRVCSESCRWAIDPRYRRSEPLPWRPCAACALPILTGEACSRSCRHELRRRAAEHEVPSSGSLWIAGYCRRCACSFVSLQWGVRSCSSRCRRRHEKQHRRARSRGVEVEEVNARDVLERDGWICYLCDDPIDRTAQVPEPLAPTIDHVIPHALRGPHVMANVRAAHFICNVWKGAGGPWKWIDGFEGVAYPSGAPRPEDRRVVFRAPPRVPAGL